MIRIVPSMITKMSSKTNKNTGLSQRGKSNTSAKPSQYETNLKQFLIVAIQVRPSNNYVYFIKHRPSGLYLNLYPFKSLTVAKHVLVKGVLRIPFLDWTYKTPMDIVTNSNHPYIKTVNILNLYIMDAVVRNLNGNKNEIVNHHKTTSHYF